MKPLEENGTSKFVAVIAEFKPVNLESNPQDLDYCDMMHE